MTKPCEYCGAVLPEGVDKRTRQQRSAHFAKHAEERARAAPVAQPASHDSRDLLQRALDALESATAYPGRRAFAPLIAEMRAVLATPAPVAQPDWRRLAVTWLRAKAADQAQTNEKYPRHAAAYPSWTERVVTMQRLADDLEREDD